MSDVTELTAQQIEGRLISALATIRDLWAEMIAPPTVRLGRSPSGGGGSLADDAEVATASTLLDAALASAPDIDRTLQVVEIRSAATTALNGWCRTIVQDHDVEHGIPSGMDVPAMCAFLHRWAYLAAEHDAARDMLDELTKVAAAVERIARPQRQEGLRLGACPLTWREPETAEDKPCPGRLVGDEEGWVTCDRCGTRAVAGWWEAHMTGEDRGDIETRTVTVAEIVDLARSQFGQRIQPAAVWQWVNRNRLSPVDADAKPHRFRTKDVVVLLMRRAG